jgi:hypothetical protein
MEDHSSNSLGSLTGGHGQSFARASLIHLRQQQ